MIDIKKLTVNELSILNSLFVYNDVDAMIVENTKLISSGAGDIFCIFNDGKPFGELRVKYVSEDNLYAVKGVRAYLYAFRINKEYRGKGYGKMLMSNVISVLESEGYTEFTIGVSDNNTRAKHIYGSFGFTEVIAKRTETYQQDTYSYSLYLKS